MLRVVSKDETLEDVANACVTCRAIFSVPFPLPICDTWTAGADETPSPFLTCPTSGSIHSHFPTQLPFPVRSAGHQFHPVLRVMGAQTAAAMAVVNPAAEVPAPAEKTLRVEVVFWH